MLMRYPLASKANELLGMNNVTLRAAVGLLIGHTNLRAHLYKLGYTEGQEDSIHIVCDCPVLACKRYRILGCMFLSLKILKTWG
jgi:hypothetical protein